MAAAKPPQTVRIALTEAKGVIEEIFERFEKKGSDNGKDIIPPRYGPGCAALLISYLMLTTLKELDDKIAAACKTHRGTGIFINCVKVYQQRFKSGGRCRTTICKRHPLYLSENGAQELVVVQIWISLGFAVDEALRRSSVFLE